MMITGGVP
jgi:hypothetical protein